VCSRRNGDGCSAGATSSWKRRTIGVRSEANCHYLKKRFEKHSGRAHLHACKMQGYDRLSAICICSPWTLHMPKKVSLFALLPTAHSTIKLHEDTTLSLLHFRVDVTFNLIFPNTSVFAGKYNTRLTVVDRIHYQMVTWIDALPKHALSTSITLYSSTKHA